jgi:hypothetical protein
MLNGRAVLMGGNSMLMFQGRSATAGALLLVRRIKDGPSKQPWPQAKEPRPQECAGPAMPGVAPSVDCPQSSHMVYIP